jgi:hypothetical protein
MFPSLLRCTRAMRAFGVYIYVYSHCLKNTSRKKEKIKKERVTCRKRIEMLFAYIYLQSHTKAS